MCFIARTASTIETYMHSHCVLRGHCLFFKQTMVMREFPPGVNKSAVTSKEASLLFQSFYTSYDALQKSDLFCDPVWPCFGLSCGECSAIHDDKVGDVWIPPIIILRLAVYDRK